MSAITAAPGMDAEEIRELAASERTFAALESYQAALEDADPAEPEYEVRLFDAMKAAIATADAWCDPVNGNIASFRDAGVASAEAAWNGDGTTPSSITGRARDLIAENAACRRPAAACGAGGAGAGACGCLATANALLRMDGSSAPEAP